MDHRQENFEGAHGTKLFEQHWMPDQPATGALVIVHGLKDHGSRYAETAADLVARGYSVHAADLRGHGQSEGGRVQVDTFDDYLADLEIFLKRVREIETGPLFLMGHSMGGAIATLYTITRQPALAGLVLSGAALDPGAPGVAVAALKFFASIAPRFGGFQLKLEHFSRDPEVVAACRADPLVHQPGGPLRTAAELINAIGRIQARMEDVLVPLLVLHGGADRVTPPEGSRQLHRRAQSENKTLRIFDGLYHDLLHEPEKVTVRSTILDWIDGLARENPQRVQAS